MKFAGEQSLEKTQYGEVLQRNSRVARIYLNGVRVAEEDNFLFSYNITSLTAAIKKALNRERTNVGRTAYSDRVKSILLSCNGRIIAEELIGDLKQFQTGIIHDELRWSDVSAHAAKILNAQAKVVFLTPSQLIQAPQYVDLAKQAGFEIVTIPDNVKDKISGQFDLSGNPIQDLNHFQNDWNDSFQFKFIEPQSLSPSEKAVYDTIPKIVELIGGLPANVEQIRVSETMRMETYAFVEAVGLWEPSTGSIVIKRAQLRRLEDFAGTLLHEIGHARSGASDISSEFEKSLTELLGKIGSRIDQATRNTGLLSRILGG